MSVRHRVAAFLVVFSLGSLGWLLADCTVCSTGSNNCGCCYEAVSSVVESCQSGCSSNCVRMSPAECEAFRTKAQENLEKIRNSYDFYILSGIAEMQDSLNAIAPLTNVAGAVSAALALVAQAKTNVETMDSAFSETKQILLDIESGPLNTLQVNVDKFASLFSTYLGRPGTSVIISNTTTHVSKRVATLAFHITLDKCTNSVAQIHDMIEGLATEESFDNARESAIETLENIESKLSSLNDAFSSIRQSVETALSGLSMLQKNVKGVVDFSTEVVDMVANMNCNSCGQGDGTGTGGTGGTGGGNVNIDLTPVVQAIENLQYSYERNAAELYSLLNNVFKKLFDAFNGASSNPHWNSEPSINYYNSMGDNWFKRVEYLLYSSAYSSLTGQEDTSVPEEPEGSQYIEGTIEEMNTDMNNQKGLIKETVETSWGSFKNSFSQFFNKLNVFKGASGNYGGVILEYDGGGGKGSFRLTSGEMMGTGGQLAGVVSSFRTGIRILWSLFGISLYVSFLFVFVKYVRAGLAFLFHGVMDTVK